jgi:hypothetical protein
MSLEEDELYPPSEVAHILVGEKNSEYHRRRKTARAWIKYHCNTPNGKKGSYNSWYGATWQEFLDPVDIEAVRSIVEAEREAARAAAEAEAKAREMVLAETAAEVAACIPFEAAATASAADMGTTTAATTPLHAVAEDVAPETGKQAAVFSMPTTPRHRSKRIFTPLRMLSGLAASLFLLILFGFPERQPAIPESVETTVAQSEPIEEIIDGESFLSSIKDEEKQASKDMSYADFASLISDREPMKPKRFFHPKLHLLDRDAAAMTLVFNENPKPEQALFLLGPPTVSPP